MLRFIALLLLAARPALAQWTYVPSGTTAELRGLSAAPDAVWASGARGTVLRSLDGGRSWVAQVVPGQDSLDFRSVASLDRRWAMVASAGEAEKGFAKIFATDDEGRAWRRLFETTEKGVFLDALVMVEPQRAIAVSDPVDGRFRVLLTSDSGRTWHHSEAMPPVLPGEAAFAASGTSLVTFAGGRAWLGTGGGGRARVFLSSDGGSSWDVVDTPVHADGPAAGIFSLATFDGRHLIAVGGDYTRPRLAAASVALSTDGGRTWRVAAAPPAAYLSGVASGRDGRLVVAVGLAGTFVSRDGGDHWTQTDTVALNSVRAVGAGFVAVGPRGRVAHADSVP